MTRTGNDKRDLAQAANIINEYNPNIVVSIHANSGGSDATGTEACYTVGKSTDTESRILASLLTHSISTKLSLSNRGIFPEDSDTRCARKKSTGWNQLYVHDMNPPSVIIETAFISNPSDADLLKNRTHDFAQAIADAIMAYIHRENAIEQMMLVNSYRSKGTGESYPSNREGNWIISHEGEAVLPDYSYAKNTFADGLVYEYLSTDSKSCFRESQENWECSDIREESSRLDLWKMIINGESVYGDTKVIERGYTQEVRESVDCHLFFVVMSTQDDDVPVRKVELCIDRSSYLPTFLIEYYFHTTPNGNVELFYKSIVRYFDFNKPIEPREPIP